MTTARAVKQALNLPESPATILSKINTVFQVLAVALVLVAGAFPDLRWIELAAHTCLFLVAGLTVASGLDYVYRVSRLERRPGASGDTPV